VSRVCVRLFALFREEAGTSELWVDTDAANLGGLFEEMGARLNISHELPGVKVAMNDEMASFDDPVEDGATVLFFPPVAGG
jgi:molybdopterin synthase sulfur carrier subunit